MMVGSNLQMLSSELQKIALYVGEKRKVDTEVIHLLVKKDFRTERIHYY